jgi:hypothetical protein
MAKKRGRKNKILTEDCQGYSLLFPEYTRLEVADILSNIFINWTREEQKKIDEIKKRKYKK